MFSRIGDEFVLKLYNVFRNKLNWGVTTIRKRFKWLGDGIGAKLEYTFANNFFDELKEEFGVVTPVFINPRKNTPVFKIGEISLANLCIYMELYPDSDSGFKWTIEFSAGSCSGTDASQLNTKFKIRFDG